MERDVLQEEIAEIAYKEKRGVIKVAMRVGKTRIGIKLLQKIGNFPRTLITYPDNKIRDSWLDEFQKLGYSNPNLVLSSHLSMHKYKDEVWDVIISDECHSLSEANIECMRALQKRLEPHSWHIGMTGSLSQWTEKELKKALNWHVIAEYSQEEAIEDGIVSDYKINIISVPLDNQRVIQWKKKRRTEKKQFDAYTYIIKEVEEEGKDTLHLRLARMRIIQGSISKMEATRKLIKQLKDEKVLVFCSLKKIADQLGIPVEHSEKEEGNMKKFLDGEIDKLVVVKMGGSGVTYPKLNHLIINSFNSNEEKMQQQIARAMNLEYVGKVANIWIITSKEPVERKWLGSALASLHQDKIYYL